MLPQIEHEKRHGNHQPDGPAPWELVPTDVQKNAQNGNQHDLRKIHVGHDVAVKQYAQSQHHQLRKKNAVLVMLAP